ncbi:MAG: hypothetical protein WAN65_13350 [Candidatus Sulfotelmatobacter sp.]
MVWVAVVVGFWLVVAVGVVFGVVVAVVVVVAREIVTMESNHQETAEVETMERTNEQQCREMALNLAVDWFQHVDDKDITVYEILSAAQRFEEFLRTGVTEVRVEYDRNS